MDISKALEDKVSKNAQVQKEKYDPNYQKDEEEEQEEGEIMATMN